MRPLRLLHAEESGVRNSHFDVSGILETWKYAHEDGHDHVISPVTSTNHDHGFYPTTSTLI